MILVLCIRYLSACKMCISDLSIIDTLGTVKLSNKDENGDEDGNEVTEGGE